MRNRLAAPIRDAPQGPAHAARSVLAPRALAVLLGLAMAASAAAADIFQIDPAPSLFTDTSIRSAAMGGASAAVTWGEPGVWANPATLSGVSGIGWVTGHTTILPEVFDGFEFSSQRVLVGGGGLGFSFMGQPLEGLGKAQLDIPLSVAFPFGGGDFHAYDRTRGWGVGLSPLRFIDSIRKLAGNASGSLTSYGEVSFGYQSKVSEQAFAPDLTVTEAPTYDWGVTGRLALSRWWGPDAPFRFTLSGAYSQVNAFSGDHDGVIPGQLDRVGAALRLSPAPPSERSASPPSLPWWRPGDVPELSVGLAYDHEWRPSSVFDSEESDVEHFGFEANIFHLLALRVGYVSNPLADVQGVTYGGGLTVPIGPWGSVGWQLADVPLTEGVDRQFRQGWSVWLDPTRFWSASR